MKPCVCGKEVRLRVIRITVNRKRGVMHWIEHGDGSKVCGPAVWDCVMLKPYPPEPQRAYSLLLDKWERK